MTKRCLMTICSAVLAVSTGLAQETPVTKTADNDPSLEATMNFIQQKMNDHGLVGYVWTSSNEKGALHRVYLQTSEVVTNASTCTLMAKKKGTF